MKIIFRSDDIKEHNHVRTYDNGYTVGNPVGLTEIQTEFLYEGAYRIQSKALRIYIDGVAASFFDIASHGDTFTYELESDFPYLQMHFELTSTGCIYRPSATFEPETTIGYGHHSLLFYPFLNGKLSYLKTSQAKSVEIELSLDFLRRLFNGDLEQLGYFGNSIETNRPAILGHKSYPVTPLMNHILSELAHCQYIGSLKKIFVEAKVIELLCLQIAQIQTLENPPKNTLKQRDLDKFYEAKELLLERLEQPYSIEELAKMVGLNRTKLQAGFKEIFGNTIFGYITDIRMEQAKEMILAGQFDTIAEIASLIGYKNAQHFTAAFKRKYGTLPKHFRDRF